MSELAERIARELWDKFWLDLTSDRWSVKDIAAIIARHLPESQWQPSEILKDLIAIVKSDYSNVVSGKYYIDRELLLAALGESLTKVLTLPSAAQAVAGNDASQE